MPAAQGTVGPVVSSRGAVPPGGFQQGQAAEVIAADFHGRKYTQNYNGLIYVASTAVAGVAPGTVLSTTPPMAIFNPAGSGVNLEILKVAVGYVSGTLGGGVVLYAQAAQASVPTGGTKLVPVSGQLGNAKTGAGQAYQGSTLAGTPTLVRSSPFWLDAFVGTVTGPTAPMVEDIDGEFLVLPGNAFVIQALAGAGTAPLVLISVTWAEPPV